MNESRTFFMMFLLVPAEDKRLIGRAVTWIPGGRAAGKELGREVLPCR